MPELPTLMKRTTNRFSPGNWNEVGLGDVQCPRESEFRENLGRLLLNLDSHRKMWFKVPIIGDRDMQIVQDSGGKEEGHNQESMSVIVWLPDSERFLEENTYLLRRLREAGLRVFAASFPDLTTTSLFVRTLMYSGEELEKCVTKLTENNHRIGA